MNSHLEVEEVRNENKFLLKVSIEEMIFSSDFFIL
ncbi:hypothetical protein BH10BAC2_BH10BAC2_32230 [soil metagenome]